MCRVFQSEMCYFKNLNNTEYKYRLYKIVNLIVHLICQKNVVFFSLIPNNSTRGCEWTAKASKTETRNKRM